MKDSNNIEQLFRDKLHDLESPVREELWANIAIQAGAHKKFWSLSKIAALSTAVLFISGAFWYFTESSMQHEEISKNEIPVIQRDDIQQDILENTQETHLELHDTDMVKQLPKIQAQSVNPKSTLHSDFEIETDLSDNSVLNQSQLRLLRERTNGTIETTKPESKEQFNVESTIVQDHKVEHFEPAAQMDLQMLIAPEKQEIATRESYHYPNQFVKFFNPNLPGDAGRFSIQSREISYFKIEISTQNGVVVFRSNDASFVWNGTRLDGSMAPEGTYLFLIESNDMNNQALKPQSGAVFLMRR